MRLPIFRFVWGQSLTPWQIVPDISEWGWTVEEESVSPTWTNQPEACYELIKCGCKKGCSGKCKCKAFDLECTEVCNCGGEC